MGSRRPVLAAPNRRWGSAAVTARENKSDGAFIYLSVGCLRPATERAAVKDCTNAPVPNLLLQSALKTARPGPPEANTKEAIAVPEAVGDENELDVPGRRRDVSS